MVDLEEHVGSVRQLPTEAYAKDARSRSGIAPVAHSGDGADPPLVGLANQRSDQGEQLGVLRPMGIPHQEAANLETGQPAA